MRNLGSICVRGSLSKPESDFNDDIHLTLVEVYGLDAVEADLFTESNKAYLHKQFCNATMVIEFSPTGYNQFVKKTILAIRNKIENR